MSACAEVGARAFRRAGWLRYAAIQFVVLVAIAMVAYPGGTWLDPTSARYQLAHNFLSDLGATRALSGRTSYLSAALFALALATLGSALVAFAPTWRGFAFARGRARAFGIASTVLGCAGGAAFVGVAASPIDLALRAHNAFVVAGFALLACYAACLAIVMRHKRRRPARARCRVRRGGVRLLRARAARPAVRHRPRLRDAGRRAEDRRRDLDAVRRDRDDASPPAHFRVNRMIATVIAASTATSSAILIALHGRSPATSPVRALTVTWKSLSL